MVDPATVRPRREVSLTAEAGDREALLVAWLNELLYLYEAHGFVAADCAVRVDTEYALSAVVRGEDANPDRHVPIGHVKAATYHLLRVAPGARGWEVQAVVDV
jgi:SHS2 domain-containing protein